MEVMKKQEFDTVYEIMKEAFPEIERRSYNDQKWLLEKSNYCIYVIKAEELIKAFISIWEYNDFVFVEHLAIHHNFRNQGLGALLLKDIISLYNKHVVLEVEVPNTKMAARRIQFYKRLGFYTNEKFAYEQPALQKGFDAYPLWLMTYPSAETEEMLSLIKKELYHDVYGIDMYS